MNDQKQKIRRRTKHTTIYESPQEQKHPALKWLIWIPFVFAFILYGNSIPNDFALDDMPQIVNHKYVQQGFSGIADVFTTNYWSGAGQNLGYYRPLSHITFAIENATHGNNPHLMHLMSVLLYALTGMALFGFLSRLLPKRPFFVLAATLLFLAHPVHTEVVANIKSRDEILSFLNSIMALWLAFNFSKNKNMLTLAMAWVFYFLALMSKETSMTTLAVLPFMLYFFTPRQGGYIAGITVSFIAVSGLFLLLKFVMIGTLSGAPPIETNIYPYKEMAERIPTAIFIFGMYLWRTVVPVRLLYDYSYNQIPGTTWSDPLVWLSFLVIVFLIYLALKNLKRQDILSFALIFFGITLSVGLAFVLLRGGIMAERFLYAPILGFSLVVCHYAWKLLPKDKRTKRTIYDFKPGASKAFVGILAVLLLFYSVRTIARNPVWKDNYTLFSTDIKYGDNSALLLKHYGSELINMSVAETDKVKKDSLMDRGMAYVQKSLEINPKFSEAYFKLGYAYYQLRDYEMSIEYYKKTNLNSSMNVSNMALAYYMNGDYGEALRQLRRALQMDPNNQTARKNLPMVENAFNRNLKNMETTQSDDPVHYYDLGNLFVEQMNYTDALQNFDKAVQLKPDYIEAMVNKGNCYYMLKEYDNAIATFEKVLVINPNSKMANKNLSHLYGLLGDTDKQLLYDKRADGIKE
jgi:tetratricopeptide (TPR) repeat protein